MRTKNPVVSVDIDEFLQEAFTNNQDQLDSEERNILEGIKAAGELGFKILEVRPLTLQERREQLVAQAEKKRSTASKYSVGQAPIGSTRKELWWKNNSEKYLERELMKETEEVTELYRTVQAFNSGVIEADPFRNTKKDLKLDRLLDLADVVRNNAGLTAIARFVAEEAHTKLQNISTELSIDLLKTINRALKELVISQTAAEAENAIDIAFCQQNLTWAIAVAGCGIAAGFNQEGTNKWLGNDAEDDIALGVSVVLKGVQDQYHGLVETRALFINDKDTWKLVVLPNVLELARITEESLDRYSGESGSLNRATSISKEYVSLVARAIRSISGDMLEVSSLDELKAVLQKDLEAKATKQHNAGSPQITIFKEVLKKPDGSALLKKFHKQWQEAVTEVKKAFTGNALHHEVALIIKALVRQTSASSSEILEVLTKYVIYGISIPKQQTKTEEAEAFAELADSLANMWQDSWETVGNNRISGIVQFRVAKINFSSWRCAEEIAAGKDRGGTIELLQLARLYNLIELITSESKAAEIKAIANSRLAKATVCSPRSWNLIGSGQSESYHGAEIIGMSLNKSTKISATDRKNNTRILVSQHSQTVPRNAVTKESAIKYISESAGDLSSRNILHEIVVLATNAYFCDERDRGDSGEYTTLEVRIEKDSKLYRETIVTRDNVLGELAAVGDPETCAYLSVSLAAALTVQSKLLSILSVLPRTLGAARVQENKKKLWFPLGRFIGVQLASACRNISEYKIKTDIPRVLDNIQEHETARQEMLEPGNKHDSGFYTDQVVPMPYAMSSAIEKIVARGLERTRTGVLVNNIVRTLCSAYVTEEAGELVAPEAVKELLQQIGIDTIHIKELETRQSVNFGIREIVAMAKFNKYRKELMDNEHLRETAENPTVLFLSNGMTTKMLLGENHRSSESTTMRLADTANTIAGGALIAGVNLSAIAAQLTSKVKNIVKAMYRELANTSDGRQAKKKRKELETWLGELEKQDTWSQILSTQEMTEKYSLDGQYSLVCGEPARMYQSAVFGKPWDNESVEKIKFTGLSLYSSVITSNIGSRAAGIVNYHTYGASKNLATYSNDLLVDTLYASTKWTEKTVQSISKALIDCAKYAKIVNLPKLVYPYIESSGYRKATTAEEDIYCFNAEGVAIDPETSSALSAVRVLPSSLQDWEKALGENKVARSRPGGITKVEYDKQPEGRIGPEYKEFTDPATVARLLKLQGITFGNATYMTGNAVRFHVRSMYLAAKDLVEISGLVNERLVGAAFSDSANAIAISINMGGAGIRGAAAHFTPAFRMIAFTKTGTSAFAHEFAHSLDFRIAQLHQLVIKRLAEKHAKVGQVATIKIEGEWTARNRNRDIAEYISSYPMIIENLEDRPFKLILPYAKLVEPKELTELNSVAGMKQEGKLVFDFSALLRNSVYDIADEELAAIAECMAISEKLSKALVAWARVSLWNRRARLESPYCGKYPYAHLARSTGRMSEMMLSSMTIDDRYWPIPTELFARAVECYTSDWLENRGRKNTYLTDRNRTLSAYGIKTNENTGKPFLLMPYPQDSYNIVLGDIAQKSSPEERSAINTQLDNIFDCLHLWARLINDKKDTTSVDLRSRVNGSDNELNDQEVLLSDIERRKKEILQEIRRAESVTEYLIQEGTELFAGYR